MHGTQFFTKLAADSAAGRLSPEMMAFFRSYLEHEKVAVLDGQHVINTHMPPWPSRAFDRMLAQFTSGNQSRLFAVTWAVTNRCGYHCWHCYNDGRSQNDLPLADAKQLARDLQARGAVMVNLTGGEPLLRDDLEEILDAFEPGVALTMTTTGDGLTLERAAGMKARGLFAMGISLDSTDPAEHDRLRGREGAFDTALRAIRIAEDAGLYPYFVSLGTREFLERERFYDFLAFARDAGAREVHVLEPAAAGKLDGRSDILLTASEREQLLTYQREVAKREDLPILSTLAYLESGSCFGCGAGLSYLYVDGSGEVCPCNLVPMSFGNVQRDSLETCLARLDEHFKSPRMGCVGKQLAGRYPEGALPTAPGISASICEAHLPREHALPAFERIRVASADGVGVKELREAYDTVHSEYERHWVSQAAGPVDELVGRLDCGTVAHVFEAGCGTGYGTAALAAALGAGADLLAADLSEGMLSQARVRVGEDQRVELVCGDALAMLAEQRGLDLVFSSWVLGYIPLRSFFEAVAEALAPGGRLAFVVHRLNSPELELRLFRELVSEDPSMLTKSVDFDFPRDMQHVADELARVGMECEWSAEDAICFPCDSPEAVLEHLLKSGAGTAFHDAIAPARRDALEAEFLTRRRTIGEADGHFRVTHDYVACIARKPKGQAGG
jgi:MoaA/NifB/PqqE/SkfB family radical SAM enzyme/SAM-dependent methyltransferase